ncbi:hypothetical protein J6590_072958 [Homalodisca vitripennis]|nr:hypothetical protein J6590_072958 [Homalodisca vitripennis]
MAELGRISFSGPAKIEYGPGYKRDLTQGSDVHGYNTRGRDDLRIQSHRTMAYEQIPSQVTVKVINRFPEYIKGLATKKRFKARLRDLLVSDAFCPHDEFMTNRLEGENYFANSVAE